MITTTCTECGDEVSVPVARGRVVVDPGGDLLTIRCPGCGALVTKPLTPRLTTVLLRQGARPTPTPLRPRHPEGLDDPDAPSFTVDDLRLAHDRLRGASTVVDLLDLMAGDLRTGDVGSPIGPGERRD